MIVITESRDRAQAAVVQVLLEKIANTTNASEGAVQPSFAAPNLVASEPEAGEGIRQEAPTEGVRNGESASITEDALRRSRHHQAETGPRSLVL